MPLVITIYQGNPSAPHLDHLLSLTLPMLLAELLRGRSLAWQRDKQDLLTSVSHSSAAAAIGKEEYRLHKK